MSALNLPSHFTRQPQTGAVVLAPLVRRAKSLVLLPPHYSNRETGAQPSTNGGAGIVLATGVSGLALDLAGNSSGGLKYSGVGGGEYLYIYHGALETPASGYGRLYSDENVSANHIATYNGGAIQVENGPFTLYSPSTKRITLVINCSTTLTEIYIDGILVASAVRTMAAYQNVTLFNRETDWARQLKGRCYLSTWIPKSAASPQAADISRNPWQIFRAPPRFYFAPSGGATAYTLTADSGEFALTGTGATLAAGRVLPADSGAFALTGTDATLTRGRVLAADSGSYALTGTAATLAVGHVLSADSGSIQLTGTDVTLDYTPVGGPTYTLTADSGSFAATGTAAVLAVGHVLSADSNSIVLTGTDATLTLGGAVLFTPEELAYILAYVEANMAVPTVEEIAAAVIAALNATTIPVNVKQFNSTPITGTGRPGDPVTAT
jgi:hypothetical protein